MQIRKSKCTAIILLVAIVMQLFTVGFSARSSITEESALTAFVPVYKEGSYGEYLQTYLRAAVATKKIDIDIHGYTEATDDVTSGTVAGVPNCLITTEESSVTYTVNVPSEGLYSIYLDYYPIEGKGAAIERSISINGAVPYTEANAASLDRRYVDNVKDRSDRENYFTQDASGNQIRPSQVEEPIWIESAYYQDSSGSYSGALRFYLKKGANTITIESVREPLAISAMWLDGGSTTSEYFPVNFGGDQLITTVEAEYPSAKSDSTLFAGTDRASAATSPASAGTVKMNILGSTNGSSTWKTVGQWVEYEVDIPAEGDYKLVFRARQNVNSGAFSSREISINGALPYAEASSVRFNYSSDWQMVTPMDEYNSPVLFHFEEGKNTIRVKAVLGEMTDIVNAVEAVIEKLNIDNRKFVMLMGNTPDQYRDYDFQNEIPEVIADLKAQADTLTKIYNELINLLGETGSQTAQLYTIIEHLYKMHENPENIAQYYSTFKNNIGTLGSWLITAREQPLELDYILVAEPDYVEPKAEKGFFANMVHQVSMFFSSFFTDVNAISAVNEVSYDKQVTVWMTNARDQAQILRQIVDRSFIPEYEIDVDLELVPAASLLPSVLAGVGPDVALNLSAENIVNYAARNALQELNVFDDLEEIKTAFHKSAFESTFVDWGDGNVLDYALPETVTYNVLFYRQDTVEDLGIELPTTWDEVYDIIAVLQKQYMDFAPPDYLTLLYQNGGTLYKNSGSQINLDDELSIQTFIQWTDLYTSYKLPISFDFSNRFRFNEMPIGMQLFDFYNKISVFAPEIKGLWSFTTVPGVEQEDGTVNNTVIANYIGCVMMAGAEDQDSSWEFMKWWTGADAQIEFGKEIESILGAAARYNTANIEAMEAMPWKASELKTLLAQLETAVGYPQYVGSYQVTRYLDFAFNDVVVNNLDPREVILDSIKPVNDELEYKRIELGLPYITD
ncbi:MAG: extracellular solute-binding protein [Clostridia bacterium]|nr:extracellular solute-binding protein [Clostridia bacterium]